MQKKKTLKIVQQLSVTPHFNDCFVLQKLRFGGRQSNVSMTITGSRVTGTTISIVNSQSIRVALSSLLDSWKNTKLRSKTHEIVGSAFVRLARGQCFEAANVQTVHNHNNMRLN